MFMSVSNKNATVAPSPAIRRDDNPSKHPDFQSLVSNFHLARIESQMPEYLWPITKDHCDLRRSERAIIVALVRPILREGIPEQFVNARCEIAAEIIWSNLQQFNHRPHSGGKSVAAYQSCCRMSYVCVFSARGCRRRNALRLLRPTNYPLKVKCRLRDCVDITTGVRRIAADLLQTPKSVGQATTCCDALPGAPAIGVGFLN
jgi:hypothetical protein